MKYPSKIFKRIALTSITALFLGASANCLAQTKDLTTLNYTIEEAPEWTSLFVRNSGWFGADGIFAIPSDGVRYKSPKSTSENMFIFSDSMIGEIVDGKLQPGSKMVHNTVAIVKGAQPKKENIDFEWAKTDNGKPKSMFSPNTPSSQPGDYYWLGDGFFNAATGNTYIFGYRMHTMDPKDDWSFREMGTNLVIIPKGSKAPFKNQRQIETPLHYKGNGGGFGAGVFVNTRAAGAPSPDGYVYVYGVKGRFNLVVSRVLPKDFENFTAWRFWDGKTWNTDKEQAATITTGVSNELSVSPLPDGRYALIFQLNGMSSSVALRLATSPVGPFGPVIKLYEAKKADKKFITYNAKAHPSLSAPREILISYNQNTYDFNNQLNLFPNLYHPYFLRLKLK